MDHSDKIELNEKDDEGLSAFMHACRYGHYDVAQLLLNHSDKIELNAKDNSGETALMQACRYGRNDVVK